MEILTRHVQNLPRRKDFSYSVNIKTQVNGLNIRAARITGKRGVFIRVGRFFIVDDDDFPQDLPDPVRNYPLLIHLRAVQDTVNGIFSSGGWGGWTIAAIAAMIVCQDVLKDSLFVDFGAGDSAIFSIVAKKLGAGPLLIIEENTEAVPVLKANALSNGVIIEDDSIMNKKMSAITQSDVAAFCDFRRMVIASNIPYGGAPLNNGNAGTKKTRGDLEQILDVLGIPDLYIDTGGPAEDIGDAEEILNMRNGIVTRLGFMQKALSWIDHPREIIALIARFPNRPERYQKPGSGTENSS